MIPYETTTTRNDVFEDLIGIFLTSKKRINILAVNNVLTDSKCEGLR